MREICKLPLGMRLMASENGHEVMIDRGYRPYLSPRDMRYLPSVLHVRDALVERIATLEMEAEECGRPFMSDPKWLAMANAAVLVDAAVPTRVRRYIEEINTHA